MADVAKVQHESDTEHTAHLESWWVIEDTVAKLMISSDLQMLQLFL